MLIGVGGVLKAAKIDQKEEWTLAGYASAITFDEHPLVTLQ